jgi:Trypsin
MRYRVRTVLTVLLAALTGGVIAAAPAGAITGGTVDSANRFSNVGMIVFYDDGGRYRCSATLVAPKVLLTAAHCTYKTEGRTIVSFRPLIDDAPPSDIPVAADPAAGYTKAPAGWYAGTAYSHPQYSDFTDMDNWNDVGVVRLDTAPKGITPAKIAPRNYLDRYAQPALNKILVTVVGYGTEVRQPDGGPQKPVPMSYPIVRRYADAPGQKLTAQILQVNGNENDPRGTGGSCFGDSGGPSFHNNRVVTVTSYGYTDNCRYIDGLQRVDIPVVQTWLATFGITPTA